MTITRTLITGLLVALVACIPVWQYVFHQEIPSIFPLGWMAVCLNYMSTFFHELGHTIAAWYYGYATIPMFDFEHGGGMAYSFGGQKYGILIAVWLGLAYGVYTFTEHRWLQIILGALLGFNLLTFWSEDTHRSVIDFMGPGAEPLIAGFFLFRAIFDLAPRGDTERYLNAIFGFGFIFRGLIDAMGLLSSEVHRLMYFNQKGQHGFGDFDKIADRMGLDFGTVAGIWIAQMLLCVAVPFILLAVFRPDLEREY